MGRTTSHRIMAVLAFLVAACGTEKPALPVAAQSTRDSAGIRISDNPAPAWTAAEALVITAQPTLVIGNRAGANYELGRVRGAARLSDGRIVVADGSSSQLRIYDSTGTFTTMLGRPGDGPGEFAELSRLTQLRGDTLVVEGRGLVSYLTGEGKFLWRMNTRASSSGSMRPTLQQVLAAFGNGTTVRAPIPMFPNPRAKGDKWIESTAPVLVNRENEVVGAFDSLPFMAAVMDDHPRPPWFGAHVVVANNDDTFYYGFGNEYKIRVFGLDGRLKHIITRRWTPVTVTAADIEAYQLEWGKRWIKSTGAEAEKEWADLRDDPYATEVPAFSQFIADRAGRLWVREAHIPDAAYAGSLLSMPLVPSVWSVFDSSGSWLGDVTMPVLFLPMEIGSNYVLGVARDADGVETVVRYGLQARAGY